MLYQYNTNGSYKARRSKNNPISINSTNHLPYDHTHPKMVTHPKHSQQSTASESIYSHPLRFHMEGLHATQRMQNSMVSSADGETYVLAEHPKTQPPMLYCQCTLNLRQCALASVNCPSTWQTPPCNCWSSSAT